MNTNELVTEIEQELQKIKTMDELSAFHREYLSKTGKITMALVGLRDIEPAKRGEVGARLNELKRDTEMRFFKLQKQIADAETDKKLQNDNLIDITIPTINEREGSLHPITAVTRKLVSVCSSMGFHIADGAEVVTEYENFDSVNVPDDHPARDTQDTFWLNNGQLLKTQTSASQNAILKKYKHELQNGGVLSAIFPGRCYRNEATDASHEYAFFQCEGLMVGEDISIANLIYVIKELLEALFDQQIEVRLRPGFFPFTEPGFELDASCPFCGGKGCPSCKNGGWLEIVPCGMIHENVLKMAGIDPTKYQGFAFGFGLTRLAMMKFGVSDIRLFNSCNLEFLKGVK
ncbi:MAG: phenylalanine--tRNA ligase subunit alpha [Christensenellaceae bacterium]|nr:phenylalanine--tRNA ligase subunit alpha [Christensenellaceae bacterium]